MKEKLKKIYDFCIYLFWGVLAGLYLVSSIKYHYKAIDYFTATTHLAYHHLEQVGCDAIVGGKVD